MAAASVTIRCLAVIIAVASPSGLVSAVVTPQKTNATVEIAPGVRLPFLSAGVGDRSIWVEVGGRGLDTAFIYGDKDQKATGEVIAKSGAARSDLFVITKVPCCPSAFLPSGCTFMNATANLEHDLEMLGIEQVDLMLLHWPCSTMDESVATWKHVEKFLSQGKARAIGVSNFNGSQLEEFVHKVSIKPAVNQVGFSIGNHAKVETNWGQDDVTLATARKLGVTLQAWAPLGGSLGVDVLHNPVVLDVASKHNRSSAEVALRWLVQKGIPLVTSTTKKSHAVSDLSVLDFELTEAEMQRLSAVQPSESTVIEI